MAPILWHKALLISLFVIPGLSSLITITSNVTKPAGLVNSSTQGNLTALIPLTEVDYHWIADVSIGGQSVLLCVDTGSSPL